MSKIYYVHGYLSEPNSTKGTLLKKEMDVIALKYRDVAPEELVISDCVKSIKNQIQENSILIGSSLGGLLAAKVALAKKVDKLILLNPAIIPINYDINKITDMPKRILKEMIDPSLFDEKIDAEIYILIGKQDNVVPNSWPINFAEAQNAKIMEFDDDHSFSQNLINLPSIIRKILNKKG